MENGSGFMPQQNSLSKSLHQYAANLFNTNLLSKKTTVTVLVLVTILAIDTNYVHHCASYQLISITSTQTKM